MKAELLEKVKQLVEKRMDTSWQAMEAAKNSANEEGKSSAGDKYETARAMGQIDREMNGRMYEQARQDRLLLEKINLQLPFLSVGLGALVKTTMGDFFVAIGAGVVTLNGKNIMVISSQSPIGQILIGKSPQESFEFRGKAYEIVSID
ncbi:transcription elongation factor [Emticicia sp. BO119]|uniref:transcription elongation factor n=1 Tax=Emticicia sp. BO119 TaxID=2757768 RepID=UPI0015F0F6D0|nr:transcription elongation factor [Emticicia sp. BO119]MBA4853187.1 transcription elongation factor [Emticicia sp. BO119]